MSATPSSRLLVVDDETEFVNALCKLLSEHGYEAVGLTDGRNALEMLERQDFDVLLTDLVLPKISGVEMVREALRIDPNIVPIVMTGHGKIETAVETLKAGAFDYILKPFKLPDLLPVIARALDVRRLRQENVQLRETVAMQRLAQAIASTLDRQSIVDKVIDAAMAQCNADEGSIMLPAGDADELYVAAARGPNRERIVGQRLPLGAGIAGWVGQTQQPLTLHGEVADPRFAPVEPRPDIRSSISMPMMAGGELVGVLNLNVTHRRRPFTAGQVKGLNLLVGTAASALAGVRLYEQAKQAEARYRSIFENAVEGIWQTTPSGQILTANTPMARILGYDSAEQLLAEVTDIVKQVYLDPHRRAALIRMLETQDDVRGFEFQVRRRDGHVIWVSENVHVARDAEGQILCFEGTIQDVTEAKQYETEIDKLAKFPDENPHPVFRMANDGTLQYSNKAGLSLLGFWGCQVGRKLPSYWCRVVADAAASGQRKELEVQCEGRTFALAFTPISKQGYVNVYGMDITRRKEAQRELQSLLRLHESTLATVPLSLMVLDADLNVLMAKQGNWPASEFRVPKPEGHNIVEVFDEALLEQDSLLERIRTVAADGGEVSLLGVRHQTPKHRDRYLDIRICGIHSPQSRENEPRVLLVIDDVTDTQLLQEQIRQTTKMEAIGRLAGGVAHDFNNLLTGIKGYNQFLLDGVEETSPMRHDLTEIAQLTDRAAALTRQLLAFSRRQTIETMPLDINDMVTGMLDMLQRLIGEDVSLEFMPGSQLGTVRADRDQLEQVLMNLAVNSRDAMPAGGVITIETANVKLDQRYSEDHHDVRPGDYVMLAVSDTGCGMDKETQTHIFDPFFTTKEVGEGTGLGLSTVYGIVKQHDGHIWVYSEPGKGATFKIYLPMVTERVAEPATQTVINDAPRGTETVLLVEDEQAVRTVAERVLKAFGYKVITAGCADEAAEAFEQHADEVALLLTDVVMPGRSGRELYDQLVAGHPSLKVLYMSGYTDNAIVHHGVLENGVDFIHKPFEPRTMAKKVREALDR